MKNKLSLILSFALATTIVVGQTGFAHGSDDTGEGNNMMGGNGMANMMENGNMSGMMNAMNSPEGQKMMESCMDFMESFDGDEKEG